MGKLTPRWLLFVIGVKPMVVASMDTQSALKYNPLLSTTLTFGRGNRVQFAGNIKI